MNKTIFNGNMSYSVALNELSFSYIPAKVNEKYTTIPGMNGAIDSTNYPLGFPTYGQGDATWKFSCKAQGQVSSYDIARNFIDMFHGQRVSFEKSEIPGYIFRGRINKTEIIRLAGDVYGLNVKAKTDPFIETVDYVKSDRIVLGTKELPTTLSIQYAYNAPAIPEFYASDDIYIENVATGDVFLIKHNTETQYVAAPEVLVVPGNNMWHIWKAKNGTNCYYRWKGYRLM